jgi:hypothetical protein
MGIRPNLMGLVIIVDSDIIFILTIFLTRASTLDPDFCLICFHLF